MPVEWNDNLKTGIPAIDDQHQDVIVMLNRLGRFRCGEENLMEAYEELQDYIDNHFNAEEESMVQLAYPQIEEHKSCHDKFVEDFKLIREKLENSGDVCELGDEIFHFVEDWIIEHYSNEDVELASYIRSATGI